MLLMLLLGAVALAVAVVFAFAVAVAVTDIRLTSLIRPIRERSATGTCLDVAPDGTSPKRHRFVTDSRAQMGPSGMVWESSATGLGRTGQPKSQANRKALQGPYKAL